MPVAATSSRRIRVRSLAAAGVCLALGLGLQLIHRTPVVDVLGSMLYVGLAAFLLRVCWPRFVAAAASVTAFALAAALELVQLTGLQQGLVELIPATRLVFGSAFDPVDLMAYAAGALLAWIAQLVFVDRARVRSLSGEAANPS